MPSNHLILSSPSPPAFNLSQHQGLFKWVSSSHHVPKYWSFSFSISPSNEYSGLISFRMNWLDLLAVRRTLKSLLQRHSSKASVLWCSAFFLVQLSHRLCCCYTKGLMSAVGARTRNFMGKDWHVHRHWGTQSGTLLHYERKDFGPCMHLCMTREHRII